MAAVLLARSLELALHFAIIGGLADVALQLHNGRLQEAILHTVIASLCVVLLAVASYVAKKLLSKD
jgi:hypothetical protein